MESHFLACSAVQRAETPSTLWAADRTLEINFAGFSLEN